MVDQLTLDCIAAQKAGMSYGKWKALQNCGGAVAEVDPEPAEVPQEVPEEMPKRAVRICPICGGNVPSDMHGSVKYCSVECKYEFIRRKQRDYYRRKKERESDGKV